MSRKSLIDETELLITETVRDARGRKGTKDHEAKPAADIADRVKAADSAMRFLVIKHKLVPEAAEETEFERSIRGLHGADDEEGAGGSPS